MKSKILSIVAISAVALTLSASNVFAAGPGFVAKPTQQTVMYSKKTTKSPCETERRFKNNHNKGHGHKTACKQNNKCCNQKYTAKYPMVKKGAAFKTFS